MIADELKRQALARRLLQRAVANGQMRLPAVPAMLDDYQAMCEQTFAALGVEFNPDQKAHLRATLEGQLAAAYAASSRSEIVITYEKPNGKQVKYHMKAEWLSVEATYDAWVATREPPYFGTTPDARVWALAGEAEDSGECPVLDIGAGTGRNALALARRGHPVDAIEMTAKFADTIRAEAERESLVVRVFERDVFATFEDLRHDYQLIVLSEVVSDFRTTKQLRRMFDIAAECLAPGGRLVFNVFLPRIGFAPDSAARQLGQQVYTAMFTYPEVATAAAGLPLEFVADDSVHDYEKRHLPETAWPPTGWYVNWVSGCDVFDLSREQSPIELRWLVYRKIGSG